MSTLGKIRNGSHSSGKTAFTLVDLLVLLAITALLAIMLFPANAASRTKSQSLFCLDNLRRLMGATMMYTHDNHDFFPPNEDDSGAPPGHTWCSGAAGRFGMAEFNPDIIADPRRCLITTYVNTNISAFLCPADTRTGIYQGTNPSKIGTRVPAARSIAMNAAVGTICTGFSIGVGHSGTPTLPVNGSWLDNRHSHTRNNPWRTYGKVSETLVPGPAQLWVLGEEDVYSLNDGVFAVGMDIPEWIDFPGTRHDLSGVFAFADGRAEVHKWADARTQVIGGNVGRKPVPNSPDWQWITQRTSARAQ